MKIWPNKFASKQTVQILQEHGPNFLFQKFTKDKVNHMEGPCICVKSTSTGWVGWLRMDDLIMEPSNEL